MLNVRRTVSSGEVVELGKTDRSRRQVPLSRRALEALDALPPRLDTPLLFPSVRGKLMLLDRFRAREWAPAIEAAGVATPARIYDLRSTFAPTRSPRACRVFELARLMGTSVAMIERHYGAMLDGSGADLARRLSAFEAGKQTRKRRARPTADAFGPLQGHAARGAERKMALISSAPGRIRTCGPLLRRQPLCPLSYGGE